MPAPLPRDVPPPLHPAARPLAPPELGVLLVEVAALPSRPVPDLQHLDDDVIALPAPPPQLLRHRQGQWGRITGSGDPLLSPPCPQGCDPLCRREEGTHGLGDEPQTAGVMVAELRPVPQPGAGQPPGLDALAPAMHTSPEWFSLSLWPRFSCLKSMPASLFRVPFPASTEGESGKSCPTPPPNFPTSAAVGGCQWATPRSPLQTEKCPQPTPVVAASLRGRVRVVPFQKVSL